MAQSLQKMLAGKNSTIIVAVAAIVVIAVLSALYIMVWSKPNQTDYKQAQVQTEAIKKKRM